jgi:hypothetical protein
MIGKKVYCQIQGKKEGKDRMNVRGLKKKNRMLNEGERRGGEEKRVEERRRGRQERRGE